MTSTLSRQPTTPATPPVDRTGIPPDAQVTVRVPVDGSPPANAATGARRASTVARGASPHGTATATPTASGVGAGTAVHPGSGPGSGAVAVGTEAGSATGAGLERRRPASTGHLVAEVASDVSTLFRQEVALAKAELREEATKAGKGAGMFAAAGGAGFFALVFVLLAVMFGLGSVMALGWAALIVGVVLAAAAGALALLGRRTVKAVHPAPKQTVETLREDIHWAQNRRH
ncbi:Putative Holin-X, holin superfamily III [Parafrankia irregularis]|uniref:Putative Holin-X, holin superfamily III n=1 Tax=Parafrankia irregularis TaxID=795642 RepID=A0A0S4QV81_9ACTN|nr:MULTISPECIES: phage holin family protein [Parafrankia]MBE3203766.1 phage holin family protein [Parafrankia sp. CH37]CUU58990.1 Putative Holin-X, holin superfamily III [Parafrankia irregularis]